MFTHALNMISWCFLAKFFKAATAYSTKQTISFYSTLPAKFLQSIICISS